MRLTRTQLKTRKRLRRLRVVLKSWYSKQLLQKVYDNGKVSFTIVESTTITRGVNNNDNVLYGPGVKEYCQELLEEIKTSRNVPNDGDTVIYVN